MKRTLSALLLACVLVGCASDSTAPSQKSVAGVYQLKSVNGSALPFTAVAGTTKTELTSDQVSLNQDGTYSEISGYRVTQGTSVLTTTGSSIGVYRETNGAVQ